MSSWSPTPEQRRKEAFWRTPPKDPTRAPRRAGVPYHARRSVGAREMPILMPSDFMPIGAHAGKHLHAVPADYLLWVNSKPWARRWRAWQPVADYLSRFPLPQAPSEALAQDGPLFYVDAARKHPTQIRIFQAGSSHLHCLPGWEDYLHAFALGALGLQREWYQNSALPHYDLTLTKHALALENGAQLISDPQLIEHKRQWIQFFQTLPKLPQ